MKALLMDVGNSRIRVKGWSGQKLVFPTAEGGEMGAFGECPAIQPLEELAEFSTAEVLENSLSVCRELTALREKMGHLPVVMVSVVPAISAVLDELWPDLAVADHRCALPFLSQVDELAGVGPDRLCNVAAAQGAGLGNALIVDAGTATTFDLLVDGVFLGGLIAPGMAFSAHQLGKIAARLAPVPFAPSVLGPGRDTLSAMAAGAWHVGIGGVEAVISGLTKERPELKVVLTGGLGHHLVASSRFLDPDWTLRGAVQLVDLPEE